MRLDYVLKRNDELKRRFRELRAALDSGDPAPAATPTEMPRRQPPGPGSDMPWMPSKLRKAIALESRRVDDLHVEIQKGQNLEKKLPELEREIARLEQLIDFKI